MHIIYPAFRTESEYVVYDKYDENVLEFRCLIRPLMYIDCIHDETKKRMNSRNMHYSFHILDHFMYLYSEKKFMHRLFTVLFLVKKKKVKNVMHRASQDVSFCNTHHCKILQGTI